MCETLGRQLFTGSFTTPALLMKFHLSNSVQVGDKPILFCVPFSSETSFGLPLLSSAFISFEKPHEEKEQLELVIKKPVSTSHGCNFLL